MREKQTHHRPASRMARGQYTYLMQLAASFSDFVLESKRYLGEAIFHGFEEAAVGLEFLLWVLGRIPIPGGKGSCILLNDQKALVVLNQVRPYDNSHFHSSQTAISINQPIPLPPHALTTTRITVSFSLCPASAVVVVMALQNDVDLIEFLTAESIFGTPWFAIPFREK
jgi:hypothetical protein